jgi:hypothetical protein
MAAFGFTLGFHGCDREIGEAILSGKPTHLIPSTNSYDWLGSGAYFWEHDTDRAFQWAKHVQKHPQHYRQKIKEPFVLGAVIDLGLCLDLTNSICLDEVQLAHEELIQFFQTMGIPMPVNEPGFHDDLDLVKRHLDCATVNFVHKLRADMKRPAFDSVRCPFTEGQPLYTGAKIMSRTHVQICVRHPRDSIRGYFRPLPPH